MQQQNSNSKLKKFVLKNWYKLGILAFLLYIFLQKDLSFQLNLNAPSQTEEEIPYNNPTPAQQPVKKEREKYTDAQIPTSIAGVGSSTSDRFDFSPFGSSPKTVDLYAKLTKTEEATKVRYLKRFSQVAISERKKYGVPSSIILANALLHSNAGQRNIAQSGNNQFGIKCDSNWNDENGIYEGTCFRHYQNAWSSFRDHSIYITSGKFQSLRQLGSVDYKAWAIGLEKTGFSNSKNLGTQLIQIIENYGLYELDQR